MSFVDFRQKSNIGGESTPLERRVSLSRTPQSRFLISVKIIDQDNRLFSKNKITFKSEKGREASANASIGINQSNPPSDPVLRALAFCETYCQLFSWSN